MCDIVNIFVSLGS